MIVKSGKKLLIKIQKVCINPIFGKHHLQNTGKSIVMLHKNCRIAAFSPQFSALFSCYTGLVLIMLLYFARATSAEGARKQGLRAGSDVSLLPKHLEEK